RGGKSRHRAVHHAIGTDQAHAPGGRECGLLYAGILREPALSPHPDPDHCGATSWEASAVPTLCAYGHLQAGHAPAEGHRPTTGAALGKLATRTRDHAWCCLTQQIFWLARADRRKANKIKAWQVDRKALIRSCGRRRVCTARNRSCGCYRTKVL